MNRCLTDRALWRIHEGEAPAAERDHAGACLRCAARSQRLVRDVALLGETLRAAPPNAGTGRRWATGSRRAAAAAVLAAAVGLAGIQAWNVGAPARPAPRATAEESFAFLQEVSDVLGSTGELGGTGMAVALALPDGADAMVMGWAGERDDGLWAGSTGEAAESSFSVR